MKANKSNLSKLGIALRKIRIEKEVSLEEMADYLGYAPAYITALEESGAFIPIKRLTQWLKSIDAFDEDIENIIKLAKENNKRFRDPYNDRR